MADEKFNNPPWYPITDQKALAVIGKSLEELGEATTILARIQIQGMDGVNPRDGEPNKIALEKEIADVYATLATVEQFFDLNSEFIYERAQFKVKRLKTWHEKL